MDVIRLPHAKAAHHGLQPTKTLMRQTVKKPTAAVKPRFKVVAPAHKSAIAPHVVVKPSIAELDAERLRHARHVSQSHLIQHFNPLSPQSAPVEPLAAGTVITPEASAHVAQASPLVHASTKSSDLLQKALNEATSHTLRPLPKRHKSRKLFRRGTAALSVLAIAGLIFQHELPTIRVQLASKHAGFAANLPTYKPSGYSLGPLQASAGQVAIKYQSTSDQRSFAITEKASNWDSETLRQMYVGPTAGSDYQTVETAGRTIYVFGSRTATWVNGGIWYSVEAKDSLSQHQLIDLASSL